MAKQAKKAKPKSGKLHVEIPRANWERIEAYVQAYNDDASRLTPRIKAAHVINLALVKFLEGRNV